MDQPHTGRHPVCCNREQERLRHAAPLPPAGSPTVAAVAAAATIAASYPGILPRSTDHVSSLPRVQAVQCGERPAHSQAPRHAAAVTSPAENVPRMRVHHLHHPHRRSAKLHAVLCNHAVWRRDSRRDVYVLRGASAAAALAAAAFSLVG